MTEPLKISAAQPKCWDNRINWNEWQHLNNLTQDKPLDNYCADCLPAYKERMVAEGKCKYPTVRFVRIIERQYDPATAKRKNIVTSAMKGIR